MRRRLTGVRRGATAADVVEQLEATRRVLAAVHGCGRVPVEPFGEPWRAGHDLIEALAGLERHAAERMRRPDVAAFAADVVAYARVVLGDLLLAAPARSDVRPS